MKVCIIGLWNRMKRRIEKIKEGKGGSEDKRKYQETKKCSIEK